MQEFDVVVLGAGAAGMMCAITAGRRGRRVAVLEHSTRAGRKILISGGGRCNFTHLAAGPDNFVSQNSHFAKSALARFTPADFVELVKRHQIPFHEKSAGQLFCDSSAQEIVQMLEEECRVAGAKLFLDCRVESVDRPDKFHIRTSLGEFRAAALVVATGGLSLPRLGATDFGYRIAQQFGLAIVEPAAALDGFVWEDRECRKFEKLAGVSLPARVSCGGASFEEGLLFTHVGLSGPAALQASLYWKRGEPVTIDLLPGLDAAEWILATKRERPLVQTKNLLAEKLPTRTAELLASHFLDDERPIAKIPDRTLADLGSSLNAWQIYPKRTVGFNKAEVTRGGVDTDELSSKTMECRKVPGLYFIGEVVDVTGQLGGFNFQWAWASGVAAGQSA